MNEKPSCPKCKSDQIQKLDLYLKERKEVKKSNSGVIGCLFIIIILLVPIFALKVFAGITYLSTYIWPVCLILAAILIYLKFKKAKSEKNLFICRVCGARLQIVLDSSTEEKNSENH